MKPVCSARKINGVHVVTLPESGKKFFFKENTFEGTRKVTKTVYPGRNAQDPQYINFAHKRHVEIKTLVPHVKCGAKKSIFTPKEQKLMDAIFNMPLNAKRIHNNKNVTNEN
jgi:hypothetical protein